MYPCLYLPKHDYSDKNKAWAEIGLKYNATSKFDLFYTNMVIGEHRRQMDLIKKNDNINYYY